MKYSEIRKAEELAIESASGLIGCDCEPEIVKLDATQPDRVKLEVRYTLDGRIRKYEVVPGLDVALSGTE